MHADDAVGSEAVRVEVAARYADADIAGPPVQGVDAVGIVFGRVDIDAGSVDIQLSAAFALAIDAVKVGLPDADRAAVHIDIDTARRAEMNARDAVMRLAAGVDVEIVEVDADILFGGRILPHNTRFPAAGLPGGSGHTACCCARAGPAHRMNAADKTTALTNLLAITPSASSSGEWGAAWRPPFGFGDGDWR